MSTDMKNTYVAIPNCAITALKKANIDASLEAQKLPKDATIFAAPDWSLVDTKTKKPRTYTGEDVIELGLAKFVAAILGRQFDARETISFETVFRACLAQYLTIIPGLKGKSLLFAWKALPVGKDKKQFTFGARLPSPQIACERHKFPNTDDETGALPLFDGLSMIWYPFVAQNTRVHQFNEAQWKLLIAYGQILDQEVVVLKAKSKEAAAKRFDESIDAAMKVVPVANIQLELRHATEEEEKAAEAPAQLKEQTTA